MNSQAATTARPMTLTKLQLKIHLGNPSGLNFIDFEFTYRGGSYAGSALLSRESGAVSVFNVVKEGGLRRVTARHADRARQAILAQLKSRGLTHGMEFPLPDWISED